MSTHPDQIVLADLYEYPSVPYGQTHPDRLATLAKLAGMSPAPVDNCRLLEVGCGEGANVISMAYTLPKSTFVGMDLGKLPIEKANALINGLGLKNVQCSSQNLLEFDPGDQKFDYVIAHGFYSWVPQIVRDKLMQVISKVLAPNGVAYISYNVYPGSYSGKRLRDFSLMHLEARRAANPGQFETPAEQIDETRNFLQLLKDNPPSEPAPARADLFHEAGLVLDRPLALVYHDVLSDHWDPFTLQQFVAHASEYGMQFMDEAMPAEPDLPKVPEAIMKYIRAFCAGDRILEQQYIDYMVARRFRRSLICRKEVALAGTDQTAAVEHMYASTKLAETKTDPDGSVTFSIPDLLTLTTPSAVVIGILRRLIATHPRRVAVKDFKTDDEESNRNLYNLFARMYRGGSVELHTQPSKAGTPTGKPVASALARYQSGRQKALSNLTHQAIELKDENAAWFLNLLDGTRDHEALLEELIRKFPDRSRGEVAAQMYVRLEDLRKLALLEDTDA